MPGRCDGQGQDADVNGAGSAVPAWWAQGVQGASRGNGGGAVAASGTWAACDHRNAACAP
ncbi:hypothetical protein XAP412_560006 [Xanthomonas phaseoli pv. phaseoli]|uniref:Uncharacterized protein n=1 Tax=Xanthomonas campestris pv. phaseoli TaxID=317013 RepID=A0AB38E340_XANCH|nr:hypothetical protein XAP6984_610006 [Xanthomonas phaseoli pv. phaseoli]SON87924.1 hypothetical protein XAP412_560006 [Xanthomonas phaseoli pv. phaseoli]SON91477.1 hypothetical protein XAP7430_570006 [Xanthomonas phaseoli pv. phaseoli]